MRSSSSLRVLALLVSSLVPVVASSCVGDEPVTTFDGGSLADASPAEDRSAPTPDASSSAVDTGAPDAAPACTAPQVACGSTCVELAMSVEHCGACGRSCGGGACVAGACGVALVRDNIAEANGFGIDETTLYYGSADKIFSCPIATCATAAPKQLVAMGQYPAERPYVDSSFMYFQSAPNQTTQRPAIYRCPVAGCPNPAVAIMGDGLNGIGSYRTFAKSAYANLGGSGVNRVDCGAGACAAPAVVVPRPVGSFAVDAQRVYFEDTTGGGAGLATCPLVGGCATRTTVTAMRVMGGIEVVGNLVYYIGPGITQGGHGVYACPTTGGCAAPTPLTRTAVPLDNLAADAQGIFWTEGDKLQSCSSVACAGGVKTVTSGLADVRHVQLDPKFVYFETAGTAAGTRAVRRIAR